MLKILTPADLRRVVFRLAFPVCQSARNFRVRMDRSELLCADLARGLGAELIH